ncbi:MAG: methyltransferase domain-containing protein [Candidatus Bathyarchaeota archaeon]|nr:MAG: methyltransferase domain-containing protein [Candidatus Bathyarchaeota archaeon]
MSAKRGWNTISKAYQKNVKISLEDIHYGPISPGERDLKLLGNVEGKDVLEMGCGGGQNAIVLAKWGAKSAGVDISEEQIKHARNLAQQQNIEVPFHVGSMEKMEMFSDEIFDIVLSSCAIGYSEDYEQTFREAFRVLRKNGLFVFCVVHPIANRGRTVKRGKRKLWGLGNYFDRRRRTWTWKYDDTTIAKFDGYHRTLQDYFNSIVSAGFIIERILEPEPYPLNKMTDEEKRMIPYYWKGSEREYDVWRRIPYTLLFKTRKP